MHVDVWCRGHASTEPAAGCGNVAAKQAGDIVNSTGNRHSVWACRGLVQFQSGKGDKRRALGQSFDATPQLSP